MNASIPEEAIVDAVFLDPLAAAALLVHLANCNALSVRAGLLEDIAREQNITSQKLDHVVAGLLEAQKSGKGQVVDAAMVDWGFPVGPMRLLDDVGIDFAARTHRPSFASQGSSFRSIPAGAARRQSPDQRTDHWNRIERPFQHGSAEERCAVRQLRFESSAGYGFRFDWHSRGASAAHRPADPGSV